MTKYRVRLVQTVFEEVALFIEAKNPEEAEKKALAIASNGNLPWGFMDAAGDAEAVSCEVVP